WTGAISTTPACATRCPASSVSPAPTISSPSRTPISPRYSGRPTATRCRSRCASPIRTRRRRCWCMRATTSPPGSATPRTSRRRCASRARR
ncbi:MAG: hypothetical protein ACPGE9_13305, partial [Algiphilus sp.]